MAQLIEDTLWRYVNSAESVMPFPIAEALLELSEGEDISADTGTERLALPFIRDFAIVDLDDEKETPNETIQGNDLDVPQHREIPRCSVGYAMFVLIDLTDDTAIASSTANSNGAPAAASAPSAALSNAAASGPSGPSATAAPSKLQTNSSQESDVPAVNNVPWWLSGTKLKPILVDYWVMKEGKPHKMALKHGFLSLCVTRLGSKKVLRRQTQSSTVVGNNNVAMNNKEQHPPPNSGRLILCRSRARVPKHVILILCDDCRHILGIKYNRSIA